jgi:molecular chaperone DnaJ
MQSINVQVPAGVESGMRLRIGGEGEAGIAGGPPGDLYVVISVREHELFDRQGPDLHCGVPVAFAQAALGAEVDVPTLEGRVKLKVPEGTQSGKVMRLRGKGPTLEGRVKLKVPEGTQSGKVMRLRGKGLPSVRSSTRGETGTETSPVTRKFVDKLRDLLD